MKNFTRGETRVEQEEGGGGRNYEIAPPPALRAPAHIIARVFSQLDCVDLINCSLVCKQLYKDSAELREGWKNEYLEACSLYGMCIKRDTHPPSSNCSIIGTSENPDSCSDSFIYTS
ncbi:uncharacterized protein LOC109835660 [Asparagus officinalis]|uniref:uncharacterized protein LOC109835660 n=1 Tax=Asparagus officinalis TaxID=4686 RepID=UPI00098DF2A5|nr:uncharacterized protein LOC109835660 [Asparagus officinalis]